ncbi:hypothetical protein ACTXT7_000133 [Hymenolepis weldensis]
MDSIAAVGSGIIRGVGMQKAGAIVSIICMYLIGGPLGLSLLLLTDLAVPGFWYGMSVGMGSEAIVYTILILRIDWKKMCKKAEKRTQIKFINKSASQGQIGDQVPTGAHPESGIDNLEIRVENQVASEIESSDLQKDDSDSDVKPCTPKILFTRALLITFCVMSIIAALVIRFCFDWKKYFQIYCLHVNGDVILVPTVNATDFDFSNCTQILP